jgi:hypothetical protein
LLIARRLRNRATTLDDKSRRTEPERDPIEAALADALRAAVPAGRFDVVSKLADELQARRLARENVVGLKTRRYAK